MLKDPAGMIEDLLLNAIVGEKALPPPRSRWDWGLTALSVLLAGVAVALCVIGLVRFFEARYSPDAAALLSAAVIFAASLLALAAANICKKRKARRINAAQNDTSKNVQALVEGIAAELDGPVRENPKTAVAIAALAGFLAAKH